jgi:hypothetical protein
VLSRSAWPEAHERFDDISITATADARLCLCLRTQPSGQRRPDDCMTRMMRNPTGARLTSDATLLLLWRI